MLNMVLVSACPLDCYYAVGQSTDNSVIIQGSVDIAVTWTYILMQTGHLICCEVANV